ncbi:protein [Escherichia coli]|uniref:Protein n=1 Tax=Escherichia coli TaxID=562 RepID=A0A376KRI4_ECOLX|nr:protein [Escherichia coli]
MNREKGVSSLALVLMLLVLGSLLLQGMSQQDRSFASRVSMESQSLRRQAIVQSALAWGKMHSWQTQPAVQCSQYAGPMPGFVCVYWQIMKLIGLPVMKAFRCGEQAKSIDGNIVFSPRGWSDFCPLKERALCQLP